MTPPTVTRELVELLGDEDGERWHAEGHIDPLAMVLSYIATEVALVGFGPDLRYTLGLGTAGPHPDPATVLAAVRTLIDGVRHLYARPIPDDPDGRYDYCPPDAPGAEPWTELHL